MIHFQDHSSRSFGEHSCRGFSRTSFDVMKISLRKIVLRVTWTSKEIHSLQSRGFNSFQIIRIQWIQSAIATDRSLVRLPCFETPFDDPSIVTCRDGHHKGFQSLARKRPALVITKLISKVQLVVRVKLFSLYHTLYHKSHTFVRPRRCGEHSEVPSRKNQFEDVNTFIAPADSFIKEKE